MIYTTPFYAVTKALYTVLSSESSTVGLEWFDSSVPIEEIDDYFKNQSEFAYGIFGTSEADCEANKDLAVWNMNLTVEIYSNYKGRKVISQKLEALLNYLCTQTTLDAMQTVLAAEDFHMVKCTVGALRINLPMYSDNGVWQSGSTTLSFTISQI